MKQTKKEAPKKPKKYTGVAKTGEQVNGTDQFVKYNFNDPKKFASFLDKKFPNWRWFNLYDKKTREQVANYTCKNRP